MTAPEHNQRAWDRMVARGDRFARPARDDEFEQQVRRIVEDPWLGASIAGREVLCLAAGGGRHGPLYAAAGAKVTVVDISAAQLALDHQVAAARGLQLRTVQASMDALAALATCSFDVVIQPVSTCYVPDVRPVFAEVARVTRPGGLYVSQHKQPGSLQASAEPIAGRGAAGYLIETTYDHAGPLPGVEGSLHRESGTLEYLHRWEQLLGGMCRAGFVIEDLSEPNHARSDAPLGSFGHRSRYLAPYVRVKARLLPAGPSDDLGSYPPAPLILP